MRRIIIKFLLIIAMLIASCSQDSVGEQDASIYLGPEPGVKLIPVDERGVRHEIEALDKENGVLRIKEITYSSEKLSLEGKASTSEAEHMLYAEQSQLIVKTLKGRKTVFLDLDQDSWNAPVNIFYKILDKQICRKTAFGQEDIQGKVRKTLEVVCEAGGGWDKHVWAEGLGYIRYAIGVEKEMVDVRLVGMELVDGE